MIEEGLEVVLREGTTGEDCISIMAEGDSMDSGPGPERSLPTARSELLEGGER